jgi:hypothetical protein
MRLLGLQQQNPAANQNMDHKYEKDLQILTVCTFEDHQEH